MENLFLLLFFASIIALLIGIIKPELILRFKDKEKNNRKKVLLIFGISIIASFFLFMITYDDTEEKISDKNITEEVIDDQKENEKKQEKEKKKFILSDDEKELLIKRYADLDSPEKMKIDLIIKNIDKYNDDEDKKVISENKERIVEEKRTLEKKNERKEIERDEKENKEKEKEEAKEEAKVKTEEKEYGLDEWWEVENQWKLKIDSVRFTNERNQFSDKEPEAVVVIKYSYENLGYEDDIQDLFMTPDNVIDAEGKVATRYPAGAEVSAKPTPVGARLDGAEKSYGLTSDEGDIIIHFDKYGDSSNKYKAVFLVPLPNE